MSRVLFRLVSAMLALACFVGCGPVTPIVTPTQTPTPPLAIPQGYHDYVVDFSLSPDGRILVIGTTLHTIILNAESAAVIKTLPIAYGSSEFSLNGKVLYLSGFNSKSLLLNTENWESGVPYNIDWYYLRYGAGIQVSPNEQTFAFASGGTPNECDGAHEAFEIRRIHTEEIVFRQINCAHYLRIVYRYNENGDRLILGWEGANFERDPSAPNLLAIIDTKSGDVVREFGLTERVEFIEDDLGVIYLRNWDRSQFLLWNLDTENYEGNSKTAKLKLDNILFLTVSLEGASYVSNSENSDICKIGKMYANPYDNPIVFQFEQANGYLAYSDFEQDEILYWDILNCRLINAIKLSDIVSQ